MKKVLVTGLSLFLALNIGAQGKSQSTIMLDGTENQDKTTIELKDGKLYVDGKQMSTINSGATIKIIKKHGKTLGKITDGDDNNIEFNFNENFPDAAQKRAMLGVTTKPSENNIGAQVVTVAPNSPAQKLGLKAGDVITKIDNQAISGPKDLVDIVGNHKGGDEVKITYERNGKDLKSDIVLEEKENDNTLMGGEDFFKGFEDMFKNFKSFDADGNSPFKMFGGNIPQTDNPRIGANVEDRADATGVRVTEITPNSVAEKAGLKVDDVITTFGGKPIKSIDDLTEAIDNVKAQKDIVLDVQRAGKVQTLYLQMPQNLRKKKF